MGSRSWLPIRIGGIYWGMRLSPLLLACALVACASSGKTASSASTATQAATPGALAPASFVRTTADAPAIRSIEVRDGLSRQNGDAQPDRGALAAVRRGRRRSARRLRHDHLAGEPRARRRARSRAIARDSWRASSTSGSRSSSAPKRDSRAARSPTWATTPRSSTRWPTTCARSSARSRRNQRGFNTSSCQRCRCFVSVAWRGSRFVVMTSLRRSVDVLHDERDVGIRHEVADC